MNGKLISLFKKANTKTYQVEMQVEDSHGNVHHKFSIEGQGYGRKDMERSATEQLKLKVTGVKLRKK